MKSQVESLLSELMNEVKRYIVEEDDKAYILDPVFGIVRNRVNAEVCKTLLRAGGDKQLAGKLINYIIEHQSRDGSWNEIHPNYNQPSALITSFIGEALLLSSDLIQNDDPVKRARDYVISQEKKPGYFLKSSLYTADHLNVDASCGAFLAQYGKMYGDETCLKAAERAAKRICENQSGGVYPYTSDKGSYAYSLNVPCIHYQGVTIYYLSKIYEVLKEEWIKESLLDGAKWLSSAQKSDGKFDWSKSGLMFAYYLSGAYAFAFASFIQVSKWEREYLQNAESCLNMINKSIYGLMLRWEPDSWSTFVPAILISLKTASIHKYPNKHILFRFGYAMYRQAARRMYSDKRDDRVFNLLCKSLGIKASTVEPSKNFPDIFMTSEILDCLGYSYGALK
jgi:hypothetical protein